MPSKKSKKSKLLFIIVALFVGFFMYAYLTFSRASISVTGGDNRDHVHKINGKPCGTEFYKGRGMEIGEKWALYGDIWERSHFFGQYRTTIYFDEYEKAIKSETKFQWFFEPALYGLKRDPDSCLQYLK